HVEPMRLRALWLESQGRRGEAVAALQAAIARRPDDALLHNTLGVMQGNAGDGQAARESFERAFALDPESAACENLARMRLDEGDRAGARALYVDALARAPHLVPARLRLASVLREAGEWPAAAAELRLCLKQEPGNVPAWSALVDLLDGALAASELEALLAACRQTGLADAARARLSLACGRVLESRGRMREGHAMITAANAWRARHARWDDARDARRCEAIAHAFTAPSATALDPTLGDHILFVVDTPAGGDDLEAALAAHPAIEAGGESSLLGELVADESRRRGRPFAEWAADAVAADWQRLGEAYLARSARLRAVKPYSTDRSPALPSLLGAAAAMLPGARVIDVRRDPLEA
ncbi:MAG TPA: tetratricopeptide repeat protein, partial [Dokdonella sp.]